MNSTKVTVLTPNGRRQIVKVAPSTTILQILEEVCGKHGFNPEDYGLIHHKRTLDLTLMFRYTGLPNNCLLEMIECKAKREDTDVVLCLQLEDGKRLQGSFSPSENLISIIQKLCPEQMSGQIQPVIIYMHRELYGSALKTTTLKNLGITSGRAILRLIHKDPEELKSQANVYVPLVKKTKLEAGEGTSSKEATESISKTHEDVMETEMLETEEIKKPEELMEDTGEVDEKNKYDWGKGEALVNRNIIEETKEDCNNGMEIEIMGEEELEIIEIGDRNAILYSLEDYKKRNDDEISDSFFELTVQDIQSLLQDLKKQTESMEDAPLLTNQLRELEEQKRTLTKLAQYKDCIIRVKFPNRLVLQGKFSPVETIQTVYDFVKSFLHQPDIKFHLFTAPPKKVLPTDLTLIEADYVPTALLLFGVDDADDENNFLKPELLSKLTSPRAALLAASRIRGIDSKIRRNKPSSLTENQPGTSKGAIPKQKPNNFKTSSATPRPSGEIPKWFKAIGK